MAETPTSWDLKPLFKSDNDPEIERSLQRFHQTAQRFNKEWSTRDDYLTNVSVLKQALDAYEQYLDQSYQNTAAGFYFHLRNTQDQTSTSVKARLNKINSSINKSRTLTEFFEIKLGTISPANQRKFLKSPTLAAYHYFLRRVFRIAKYQLSVEQEQILTLKEQPAYDLWVQMTSEMISAKTRPVLNETGRKVEASFEQIASLMENPRKPVRDQAAAAFNDILAANRDVAVNELNAIMTNKKIDDELRGYKRPDQARHHAEGIDTRTVDVLLEAVSSQYGIAQQFYKLKAQLLGVKKLAYHERNLPYGKLDKKYTYAQASRAITSAFATVDPASAELFQSYQKHRQIDVYPKPGKMGGAFCSSWGRRQPTYLLLNFTNKLRDVSTMAHEMGHGIHYELTKQTQPAIYQAISMATAEVASNFFEGIVLDKLKVGLGEEARLALLMADLNDTVSSTFRQTAFYKFEYDLHNQFRRQGYLSAQEIGALFQKHMRSYMGPAVSYDPGSENWWVYIPHFRYFFYVFSYVSGLLIAKALQKYTYEQPGFIDEVKEFLAAGNSADAVDIFKRAGININSNQFWLDGLGQIKTQLNEAQQLAKALGKIG